jgi:hypothetical protein
MKSTFLTKINWLSVVLVVTACFFTLFYNAQFLAWAKEISLFLPTESFFMQQMQIAGGLLNYGGTFLTQFFYYLFVGSTLFVLLLLLVQSLLKKAFEIPKSYLPLTFILSFALLLSLTEVFEILFALKSPGYLLAYDDLLDGDENLLEKYLLNHFANMQGGSLKLLELSIQCNLVLKNKVFKPKFGNTFWYYYCFTTGMKTN